MPVKCTSALQRLIRDGSLTAGGLSEATARLQELKKLWAEIEPTEPVRQPKLMGLGGHNGRQKSTHDPEEQRHHNG